MAKGSVKILNTKIDVQKVIEQLNIALSEEWLAFYQYWIGAQVVYGLQRADVEKEFIEHSNEEFEHAKLLAGRIKELDGIPVLSPEDWMKYALCKYDRPKDFDVISLLKDNIESERCAIGRYQSIASMTDGKDFVTCDLAKKILAQEEEHEQDLVDFMIDIDQALLMMKNSCECS